MTPGFARSTPDDDGNGSKGCSLTTLWRETYDTPFRERLEEIITDAQQEVKLALKDLYKELPASVRPRE